MIRLHWLLRDHPDVVEADLARFYQVDYRDLSTRALLVRVRHIPRGQGAAIYSIDGPEWTVTDDLLDLLRRGWGADPHPLSPAAREVERKAAERAPKLEAAMARRRERQSLRGG